jgi:hypothetical protein
LDVGYDFDVVFCCCSSGGDDFDDDLDDAIYEDLDDHKKGGYVYVYIYVCVCVFAKKWFC